jgi:membrane-bound serine protease (ClpP class)
VGWLPGYKRVFAFLVLLVIGIALLAPVGVLAQDRVVEEVVTLRVDGPIVPVVAEYLDRGISEAERRGAVCVIELSTPGGLYDTTQKIVRRILNAHVPVVVYVSPAGSWASSAGTFITISAHVAAMAPGSRIGAAHPVAGGGEELSGAQEEKITQDAAAWVRSLAEMRDRNAEKAELTVTESRSYTDKEALEYGLIDLRVQDLNELLAAIDGRRVTLNSGDEVLLSTAGAVPERKDMTRVERILHTLSNPNLAYILLSIGMLGLLMEFYNPGAIFPGAAGGLALLLALYSLGTLNADWSGVLLIILGFVLLALELFVTSFGLLTAGGLIAVTLGSLMLFSGSPAGIGINFGVIAGVVVGIALFVIIAGQAVIKAHRRRATTGMEGMVGTAGIALTVLDPKGTVLFEGERWRARAENGPIGADEEVVVVRVEGLSLVVRRRGEP